jgi:hypothetical protein
MNLVPAIQIHHQIFKYIINKHSGPLTLIVVRVFLYAILIL